MPRCVTRATSDDVRLCDTSRGQSWSLTVTVPVHRPYVGLLESCAGWPLAGRAQAHSVTDSVRLAVRRRRGTPGPWRPGAVAAKAYSCAPRTLLLGGRAGWSARAGQSPSTILLLTIAPRGSLSVL